METYKDGKKMPKYKIKEMRVKDEVIYIEMQDLNITFAFNVNDIKDEKDLLEQLRWGVKSHIASQKPPKTLDLTLTEVEV